MAKKSKTLGREQFFKALSSATNVFDAAELIIENLQHIGVPNVNKLAVLANVVHFRGKAHENLRIISAAKSVIASIARQYNVALHPNLNHQNKVSK